MGSLRYLNGVLTVIAVLLTLNLWTAWSTTPGGRHLSLAHQAQAQGFANPDAQRQQMVGELKKINVQLSALTKTLTDGSMRVKLAGHQQPKHPSR